MRPWKEQHSCDTIHLLSFVLAGTVCVILRRLVLFMNSNLFVGTCSE